MSKKYVYIAGPYTKGGEILNVRQAVLAAQRIAEAGHTPFVPHLNHLWEAIHPNDYRFWMNLCFDWVVKCDALLRLPGESSGADEEVILALTEGIPVFHDIEGLLAWLR